MNVVGAVLLLGLLTALLLPACCNATDAARRVQCSNHLKWIQLAMLLYEQDHGAFPPAVVRNESGEPMHSWRVLLLPYLEQGRLYERYHFDEPWDGPNNRQLHNESVPAYGCPAAGSAKHTHANYMVVVGEATMFPPDGSPITGADATDGTSETIMVVEVDDAGVHWMAPRDLSFDQMSMQINPLQGQGVGSAHHRRQDDRKSPYQGANVAFVDGSVHWLPGKLKPATLRALLTRNGGESLIDEELE